MQEIRTALMLVGVSSMFGAAYLSLLPAFARDILHGASTSYGTLMTAVGTGALIGAYKGQPSMGIVIGIATGVAITLALYLYDRRKG